MSNVIILKKSGVADKVPVTSDIANGELAVNYTDQILYGTNGSVVFELGANVGTQRIRTLGTFGNSTVNTQANSSFIKIANSTVTANLSLAAGLMIGLSTVNSTIVAVGANVISNATHNFVGNSTVNAYMSSSAVQVANSTGVANLTPTSLNIGANVTITQVALAVGNSTVNAFANSLVIRVANSTGSSNINPGTINLGANVTITQVALAVGNSTVNAFANSLVIRVANSTGSSNINPGLLQIGANVALNQSSLSIGNSTVNNFSNSSDILLNAVSINPIGIKHIWIPAYSMIPRTSNGPQSNTLETTTNKIMWKTLNFDSTVNEHAQFWVSMPKSYNNSTLMAQFYWSHANTTTNFGCTWSLQAVAFSDDDGMDATAFGTEVTVVDTGGTNNDLYISANSAAMTIAGTPAANDSVCFQVKRLPADAGDTTAVDCRLHGVKLWYTVNAAKDN